MPDTVADTVQQHDQVTDPRGNPVPLADVVADKGCWAVIIVELSWQRFRTYISEADHGRQSWPDQAAARDAVYANLHRIGGARGRHLLRRSANSWNAA